MSGLTPAPYYEFRRQLRARGIELDELASLIDCGRAHLSQVLWGHRAGGETWPLLRAVLTDYEWGLLLQMEHCATWNNEQVAKGDTAAVWLMRVECKWCNASMGLRACVRTSAGKVSHGICPDCYTAQLADLDALAARQVARDVTAELFAAPEFSSRLNHETKTATPSTVDA